MDYFIQAFHADGALTVGLPKSFAKNCAPGAHHAPQRTTRSTQAHPREGLRAAQARPAQPESHLEQPSGPPGSPQTTPGTPRATTGSTPKDEVGRASAHVIFRSPPRRQERAPRDTGSTPRPGRNLAENRSRKPDPFLPAFCQPWPPQGGPQEPPGTSQGATKDPQGHPRDLPRVPGSTQGPPRAPQDLAETWQKTCPEIGACFCQLSASPRRPRGPHWAQQEPQGSSKVPQMQCRSTARWSFKAQRSLQRIPPTFRTALLEKPPGSRRLSS